MKKISLGQSMIPIVVLIALLALNVYVFESDATYGSNQFSLLLAAAVAAIIGIRNGVKFEEILDRISLNLKATTPAILILLFVGSLAGTWLLSGIVPAMIYYGLNILTPTIFFVACILICIVVSMATGSSWTTSATIGIALIGIGNGLGLDSAMTAGAVLSGAYFGDKMSPLSDTTNLAPAIAGTDLNTHIKYMTITTVPTIIITLIVFLILGFTASIHGNIDKEIVQNLIADNFNVSPWLFTVPLLVIILIVMRVPPLMALLVGTVLGGVAAIIFQQDLLLQMSGAESLNSVETYRIVMNSITVDTIIPVEEVRLENGTLLNLGGLFEQGGMAGMLGTVWLIICAMAFGGALEAIGALKRISEFFLGLFQSVFGLFASTVATALALNITASDQYLAIVVSGKMFSEAYKDKGLAPENLSRTLEDSATVTSVLVPWNTCGAYHSKVLLGEAGNMSFIPYAIFNYLSPFMTLLVAAIGYKIRMRGEEKESIFS
ncbi:sodium:proton antiporter [Weeksellaceae bacterium KMM 9713]|uniref:Sodium:proton antiporter n=1 Tax=Profundicola chukchiensis TaxID=2961959 RepID=A0A9X4MWN3_9FLAO|nr:Na+/H+ antiporter NhaC family protein [Profundicola chukchiensis]MDG4944917.1 sodium:proton antiporter [Profundicola chukchiensis]